MKRNNKDQGVDYSSLNEILSTGSKLVHIVYVVTIIVLILLGTYLLREWKILDLLGKLLVVISPIFIGIIIAWLFDPLVIWLQTKKIPRIAGCIIIYLFLIGLIFLVLYAFFPMLIGQVTDFIGTIPDLLKELRQFADKFFSSVQTSEFNVDSIKNGFYNSMETFGANLTTDLPNKLINAGKALISGGANFVLGLMIGFYMLFDFDKINKKILKCIPKSWKANYKELASRLNTSLRNYVQGVFLIMFLVFITQSIGLTIAGLKAPLVFALFCAITDIIPYFGPYIGAIPAVLVGFTISPATGIFCIISIVIVQALENNFYQPLIMGHTMQLHPVTIMVGLLIFGHFFGILGMVLATPIVACIKIVFMFINEKLHFMEAITKE